MNGEGALPPPGAARFGNFPDYYRFNPSERRMTLVRDIISSDLYDFKKNGAIKCVDIGCNTGELTVELHNWVSSLLGKGDNGSHRTLGIDLDNSLIQCAQNRYTSLLPQVQFVQGDVMSWIGHTCDTPLDMSLGLPTDAVTLVFCFSVTLWIHINHGDAGLLRFLQLISERCHFLILEPQPWRCYRTAVRRMKRAGETPFPLYDTLKIRQNVVEYINEFLIEQCGMDKVRTLGTTDWDRTIILYKKRQLAKAE